MTEPHRRIVVLNGPNLNLLGTREPELYGTESLADVEKLVRARADEVGYQVDFFQTNHEGALIDRLHDERGRTDGVVINPGGLTHMSVALRDAFLGTQTRLAEVHVSNVHKREPFRHHSYFSDIAEAVFIGAGIHGYVHGFDALRRVAEKG